MATRRSCTATWSPFLAARFTSNASRRNKTAVWSSANSRIVGWLISLARFDDGHRPVVNLPESHSGALGAPLLQVDIDFRVNLQHHFPVAQTAFHPANALLAAA